MDSLIKKLILLKTNPKLVESLPQAEVIAMMETLIKAFRALQVSIEQNKLKGDAGYSPVPGKDYLTKPQTTEMVATVLDTQFKKYEKTIKSLETAVETRLKAVTNGKDAEITDAHVQKAAKLASQLIEIPNFATIIQMEPQAIRDSLELLQGDERLDRSAIKGLDELERSLQREIANVSRTGGGGVKQLRFLTDVNTSGDTGYVLTKQSDGTFAFEAATGGSGSGHTIQDEGSNLTARGKLNFVGSGVTVTDDAGNNATVVTIPGASGVTVETPTGTVNAVNAVFGVSAAPKWVVADGITYFAGAGYSYSAPNITLDVPPSSFIRAIV